MKFAHFLIIALLFSACGSKKISVNHAKDAIVNMPPEILENNDVDVVKVSQVGGSEAIAETRLKTAFRLERVRGHWVVRDVRIGHGQWETVDNLMQTLEKIRIEETRKMLDRIAEAVRKYRESTGEMPAFNDYISLSDLLSPSYLTPLIRLDAWRRPIEAKHLDANTIQLISAGSDGKFGSSDDIILTVP